MNYESLKSPNIQMLIYISTLTLLNSTNYAISKAASCSLNSLTSLETRPSDLPTYWKVADLPLAQSSPLVLGVARLIPTVNEGNFKALDSIYCVSCTQVHSSGYLNARLYLSTNIYNVNRLVLKTVASPNVRRHPLINNAVYSNFINLLYYRTSQQLFWSHTFMKGFFWTPCTFWLNFNLSSYQFGVTTQVHTPFNLMVHSTHFI
jgi:hypothetical protein